MPVGTQGNKSPNERGGINHSVESLGTFPILTNFGSETERIFQMSVGTILLIVLILILIGALPTWGHSRGWGYGPSGILGVIVIVILVLLLMGRI